MRFSQLDPSFGPVENEIEAGGTVPVPGAGVVRVAGICSLLQDHECLSSCPPDLKFVFAC